MKQFDNPEGATPLDPDELAGLKIKTITTRGELDRWEQENISQAINWLTSRRNKSDMLNEAFVRKLHERMFSKVWEWAGEYRRTNKNIGVDKARIGIELRSLLDDVWYWGENKTYEPDEIAARFHHRMVFIHPFSNGNGRHARLIAEALQKDLLGQEPFSWGNGDLVHTGDVRQRYIQALRAADNHDYEPLKAFVRS